MGGALIGSSLIALAIATPAFAQAADPAPAEEAAEEPVDIVVTGSRIQRRDAETVGPLLTLTADDISKSGTASPGELLQRLPSAGVSLNSNGTQGTSYGAASINLRYLGGGEGSGNRVLVLVNGHRWVDAVGQRGFRDFVDLNTIPMGMIDGVEVLKDGASAIYGADAIAGVVNIKTIQPFDGIRGSIRAATTDKGDGEEYTAILNVGKRVGRASFILSGSYFKSQPILTSARDLTTLSLVPVTAPGTSPNGLYILPGLANNAYFGTAAGFGSSASPIASCGVAARRFLQHPGAGHLFDRPVGALWHLWPLRLRGDRRHQFPCRRAVQPAQVQPALLTRAARYRQNRHFRRGSRKRHGRRRR